jgi:hypothetical protein
MRDCVCAEGSDCDGLLECESFLCEPGNTTGDATSTSTSTSTASTTTSLDDSSSDGPGTTAETSDTQGEASSSSTTDDPEECSALTCEMCTGECAVEEGQPCNEEVMACEAGDLCTMIAGCLLDCSLYGACGTLCCEGHSDGDVAAARALHECLGATCAAAGEQCDEWEVQASCQ